MLFYTSSIPIPIRTTAQVKQIEPTPDQSSLNPDHVYSLGRAEWEYLENHIKEKDFKIEEILTLRDDSAFANWEHMPMFLGRKDPDFVSLEQQLKTLKAKHPNRTKFKIAINNGFGSSLGDSMIGITAFKSVYPILKEHLQNVEIDIIMGWTHDESVVGLYEQVPEFSRFIKQNCTLADLSSYQAVFDFYGLLKLPNYGKIPVVDWCMMWMGLDISNISSRDKRNSIYIPIDAGLEIETLLGEFDGKTILLNQAASVDLRSIPSNFMNSLVQHLLDVYPNYRFVTLQKLDIDHPRILDFTGKTRNLDLLAALVYKVDCVITPDTYILHLSDATNTPCVALFTSVSPRRYPYYPLTAGLLLPGATDLPAWDSSKTTNEEWLEFGLLYESAWKSFDLQDIKSAIDDVILRKPKFSQSLRNHNTNSKCVYEITNGLYHGKGFTKTEFTNHIENSIKSLIDKYLVYGDHVIFAGSSYDALIFDTTKTIGELGKTYVFEPRRMVYQMLCANAVVLQLNNIHGFNVLPYDNSGDVLNIKSLDMMSEYNTVSSNNCAITEKVFTARIDDLHIKQCRMIVIHKPIDTLKTLTGCVETINRLKPMIVSCVKTDECSSVMQLFDSFGYTCRVIPLDTSGEYSLIMGVAKSK